MESIIKDSLTKTCRKFDKSFKCEVVRNWLSSGKSAAVIAKEFGLNESLLFAWRKFLPPAEAGGRAAAGAEGLRLRIFNLNWMLPIAKSTTCMSSETF
jgi:transposase-like protein